MKKLFSILLSFSLVLGMGSVALAAWDGTTWTPPSVTQDYSSIPLYKSYAPVDGPTTSFNFTIAKFDLTDPGAGVTFENMPVPTIVNPITFPLDTTETELFTSINLPTYTNVGVYEYIIQETNAGVPWVTYDGRAMILKVTVIQGATPGTFYRIPVFRFATLSNDEWVIAEGKGGEFENDYNAGSLTLEKEVTGNLGDLNKYFKFTVTFTDPTDFNADSTIAITGGSTPTSPLPANPTTAAIDGASFDVYLKDGDILTFSNIPYGVTYTIVEENLTDYIEDLSDVTDVDEDGVLGTIDSSLEAVKAENNKNTNVDTGISLDSLPYVLILGFAVIGMGVLFVKKRQNANF